MGEGIGLRYGMGYYEKAWDGVWYGIAKTVGGFPRALKAQLELRHYLAEISIAWNGIMWDRMG